MIKQLLTISLVIAANLSHASQNGLSIHSRNNCGNNESISWDGTKTHHLGTNSYHFHQNTKSHPIGSGIAQTNRSAAVCWGEGTGGWVKVYGEHYLFQNGNTKLIWLKTTEVTDCSIYDGWWEI